MKKRRVPIALWRRLVAGLSQTAITAGDETGYRFAAYRADRDEAYPAFEAAVQTQVAELGHELTRHGEGSLVELLGEMRRGVDPYMRPRTSGPRADAQAATHTRTVAAHAAAVAARLREFAEVADVVALGLELRAEDHDDDQRITDLCGALRPSDDRPRTP